MTHDGSGGFDAGGGRDTPTPEVLERYLAGECSQAERERVEFWLESDPEHGAYVRSLRMLGETWAQARPRFDSRAAWRRMAARTVRETASTPSAAETPPRAGKEVVGASPRHATLVRRGLAAAAVIAAALGAVVVGSRVRSVGDVMPAGREYVTTAGQQIALTLSDGTRLLLAPRSRLIVDAEYGRGTRTVQLAGQAYFNVVHDNARPFRVRAGDVVAWDLGTKFTVRAYGGERLRIAVEEGSVAVPQTFAAPLLAGDVAVIDSAGRGGGTVEHRVDLGRYIAWTRGTLEFRNTPLGEVAADLSRWYGVDIAIGDSVLASRHLTVAITESSIDAVLELVAPAVGARYKRRGRSVTLYSLDAR